MNCEEVNKKWKAYIDGECTHTEDVEIEQHLMECMTCNEKMDKELAEQENRQSKLENTAGYSIPIKKQKQLLQKAKWRHRTSNILMFIGFLIVFTIISSLLTSVYYGWGEEGGKGEKTSKLVNVITQMTMPNVYASRNSPEYGMFLNATLNKELRSKVGKEQKTVGKLNGTMFFDMVEMEREWFNGQYDINLSFVYPDFFIQEDPYLYPVEEVWKLRDEIWEVLDLLPEGTVSEVAISFDQLYSIDQVYSILSQYPDLEIVWYAMDTGSEVEHSNRFGPFLHAGEGLFGFHEYSIWDFMETNKSILARGDGKRREEAFINSLKFVSENEGKGWIRRYFYGESIQKRLDHVKKHGSKSYGVVLTGPTKELLKLQNVEQIQYASLGEVHWWNMHSRGISGSIRN